MRREPVRWIAAVATLAWVSQAISGPSTYSLDDFPRVEKIDTHVHLDGRLPKFMAQAQADGFRLLTINVNYSDFASMPQQYADALELQAAYPDRVAFAATFDAAGSDKPDWLVRTRAHLEE